MTSGVRRFRCGLAVCPECTAREAAFEGRVARRVVANDPDLVQAHIMVHYLGTGFEEHALQERVHAMAAKALGRLIAKDERAGVSAGVEVAVDGTVHLHAFFTGSEMPDVEKLRRWFPAPQWSVRVDQVTPNSRRTAAAKAETIARYVAKGPMAGLERRGVKGGFRDLSAGRIKSVRQVTVPVAHALAVNAAFKGIRRFRRYGTHRRAAAELRREEKAERAAARAAVPPAPGEPVPPSPPLSEEQIRELRDVPTAGGLCRDRCPDCGGHMRWKRISSSEAREAFGPGPPNSWRAPMFDFKGIRLEEDFLTEAA